MQSEDQRERFESDGFLRLEGIRPPEICQPTRGDVICLRREAENPGIARGALILVSLFSSIFLLLVGCRPFVMIPGGELDGTVVSTPNQWAVIDETKTVQLETRPSEPYSVNIWAVAMGPSLYVHAGANRSAWVVHIEADPEVRVRVKGNLYELRATRVEAPEEFAEFCDAYDEKFGLRPKNENVTEAYVFRLDAR